MRKFLKIALISIFSIILLVIGIIAIAVNFVFTPSKLTPVVQYIANNNIKGEVELGAVDLTFFSTFPEFSLKISDGVLKVDSLYASSNEMQTDTIASFRLAKLVVDPIVFLKEKKIDIRDLEIHEPNIYAYISSQGAPNWDIVKEYEDKKAIDSLEQDTPVELDIKSVELSNISVLDAKVVFDDRNSGIFSHMYDLNMSLKASLDSVDTNMIYTMSFQRGLLYMNNTKMFSKLNFSLNADMSYNKAGKELSINNADVFVNSTKLLLNGTVKDQFVDLKSSLVVKSIGEVMAMIPEGYIEQAVDVETTGSAAINAHILGSYKDGLIPTVKLDFSIIDATLQYKGFKNKINNLTLDASMFVDLNKDVKEGYLNVNKFYFDGASSVINATLGVKDILKNPEITLDLKSNIDFTELAQTVPFQKGISMGGNAKINIDGTTALSQIQSGDYASIKAKGSVELNNMFLKDKNKDFELSVTRSGVGISNDKSGLLKVIGGLGDVKCTIAQRARLSLDSVVVNMSGIKSAKKSYLEGVLSYKNLYASVKHDSISLRSGLCSVGVTLSEKSKIKFKTDSLAIRVVNNRFDMNKANVNLRLSKDSINGFVGFRNINIVSAMFPLPIKIASTVVTVRQDSISLKRARFEVGDSDLTITGNVGNLLGYLKDSTLLTADVSVNSDYINLTQIMRSVNYMHKTLEEYKKKHVKQELVADEDMDRKQSEALIAMEQDTTIQIIPLPNNINVNFNSNFKRVHLGDNDITDVKGRITMADGSVKLRGLALTALGAKMHTRASYTAKSTDLAKATFTLDVKNINIHNIIEASPLLDSLMPMIRSFEGEVNLSFTVDETFTTGFVPDLKSLQSTLAIDGKNLVLLDGETFAEISKMLMFKNKKRNLVDNINMHITVKDGAIEIYPFVFTMDRYKVAVGGQHDLDNKFNYHISILKSPIPLKFGVNVSGNLDKFKFGVGKTRYKYMNEPNYKVALDPEYVKIRNSIIQKIRDI